MTIKYLPRKKRGCGYRKIGGLYLFFDASNVRGCYRLPFPLPGACPCCGEEIRQTRAPRKFNAQKVLGNAEGSGCSSNCPVCYPPETAGLMWVGKEYYTPDEFRAEAYSLGISKRIPNVPEGLKPGDLFFFAHPKAVESWSCEKCPGVEGGCSESPGPAHAGGCGANTEKVKYAPGIFLAARLTEIQKVVSEAQTRDPELLADLEAKGITPVVEIGDQAPLFACDEEGA
jgi:hypothetical protein